MQLTIAMGGADDEKQGTGDEKEGTK